MNNFFNYHRFALLIKRQWVENRKLFFMGIITLLGLGIVIYSLGTDWKNGNFMVLQARVGLFFVSFFLSGSFFTNYTFKDLSDKNSSTSFLLVPASHFEKQLSACFYVFVIFPIIFFMLFYVIDYSFVNIVNGIHNSLVGKKALNPNEYLFDFLRDTESKDLRLAFLIPAWFAVQAFVILGSITFMGWSYIKTGFAGFVILFVIVLLVGFMQKLLLDNLSNELGSSHYFQIKPTKDMLNDYVLFGLKYAIAPLLLVIAYFKLKEKQI
jgi:hypothetical protein